MATRIFDVVVKPQSYVNILYLFLAFPLSIAYFVYLVTGLSLGFGLLIVWAGIPILVLVFMGTWALCQLERALAIGLLHENIPAVRRDDAKERGDIGTESLSVVERLLVRTWRLLKRHLTNRLTWTGMLYLLMKFPVGIASFVIAVILIAFTLAFLGAPTYYWVNDGIDMGIWQIDSMPETIVLTLLGIPMLFISLHLMNGAAYLSGKLARIMLGRLS